MKIQLQTLEQTNELVIPKNMDGRRKRAPLGIIGTINKALFGTLNEDDAKYYSGLIYNLKRDNSFLLKLIKNQTSIVDSTVNVIHQSEEGINAQFSLFRKHIDHIHDLLNTLQSDSDHSNITQTFNMLTSLATLKILHYKDTQDALLEVLTDIKYNKLNPALFTPAQLRTQLEIIQPHIPIGTRLPSHNDMNQLIEIYQLMQIRTGRTGNKLIIEIHIPLLRNTQYQLYKAIPTSFPHQDSYLSMITDTDYLAVDSNKLNYYPMQEAEFSQCIHTSSQLVCLQTRPTYTLNSDRYQCEIKLMTHKKNNVMNFCKFKTIPQSKQWIQLNNPNQWIFVLDKLYTVDISCKGELTYAELQGSGTLEISPGCELRNEDVTIHSHNIEQSIPINSYFPSFNLTEIKLQFDNSSARTLPPTPNLIIHTNDLLKKLSADIDFQKKASVMPTPLNGHDVHHYALAYINLTLFCCIAVACVLAYRKCWMKRGSSANTTEINLNTITPISSTPSVPPRNISGKTSLKTETQYDQILNEKK